jgi:hypothetical protein
MIFLTTKTLSKPNWPHSFDISYRRTATPIPRRNLKAGNWGIAGDPHVAMVAQESRVGIGEKAESAGGGSE